MLTQSLNTSISSTKAAPVPFAKPDQFCALTGHAGLVATEFSYRKDEEIYGEDEPAEYVYQVIRGAVRTYKLLSDGRRQIGAFHPAGRRLRARIGHQPSPRRRSHHRHDRAPGKAQQPRAGRRRSTSRSRASSGA